MADRWETPRRMSCVGSQTEAFGNTQQSLAPHDGQLCSTQAVTGGAARCGAGALLADVMSGLDSGMKNAPLLTTRLGPAAPPRSVAARPEHRKGKGCKPGSIGEDGAAPDLNPGCPILPSQGPVEIEGLRATVRKVSALYRGGRSERLASCLVCVQLSSCGVRDLFFFFEDLQGPRIIAEPIRVLYTGSRLRAARRRLEPFQVSSMPSTAK